MSNEVLYMLFLGLVSFVAGRAMVSNKEIGQKLTGPTLAIMLFSYLNYFAFFDRWLLTTLLALTAYFVGFAGKDSLKLFLRRRVRPQAKQAVGQWTPKEVVDEEDHSGIGIGS